MPKQMRISSRSVRRGERAPESRAVLQLRRSRRQGRCEIRCCGDHHCRCNLRRHQGKRRRRNARICATEPGCIAPRKFAITVMEGCALFHRPVSGPRREHRTPIVLHPSGRVVDVRVAARRAKRTDSEWSAFGLLNTPLAQQERTGGGPPIGRFISRRVRPNLEK